MAIIIQNNIHPSTDTDDLHLDIVAYMAADKN